MSEPEPLGPAGRPSRARLVAGIDEAGLGPILGPLTIGYALLRLPEPGVNPRQLLKGVVVKDPSLDKDRIVVADSKVVYTRNPRGRKRLETTALSFLALLDPGGTPPTDPASVIFGALRPSDAIIAEHPWYARFEPVPRYQEPGGLELRAHKLRRAFERTGLELADLGVRTLPAGELNASFERTQSKNQTEWHSIVAILRHLWSQADGEPIEVVVDRQGARSRYGGLLGRAFPRAVVTLVEESDGHSEYALAARGSNPGAHSMHISFTERAEDHSFAVALASCLAKWSRELSMDAFNAYFQAMQPELKQTAGYYSDGKRWLAEATPALRQSKLEQRVVMRSR